LEKGAANRPVTFHDEPAVASLPIISTERSKSMKAIVDKDLCIGCGLCVDVCPEVFEMNAD
jgi:ferredoxin